MSFLSALSCLTSLSLLGCCTVYSIGRISGRLVGDFVIFSTGLLGRMDPEAEINKGDDNLPERGDDLFLWSSPGFVDTL